jgi:acyl dehydratase
MTEHSPGARWLGQSAERTVHLTAALVDRFVELAGDSSPIHVSDEAARARGFPGRVVHGMLLGALLSGVIGTELPGAKGVLQNLELSFRQPCLIDDEITICVSVTAFHESVNTLVLKILIKKQDGTTVATGSVRSGLG